MGYIRHHAMLVTSFREEYIQAAHQHALALFGAATPEGTEAAFIGAKFVRLVSPITESAVNSDYSFAIFPDGSKEGWGTSEQGDALRHAFKVWLKAQVYEDGSSPYAWVEVQYGDDNWETRIVDDSAAQRRGKHPEQEGGQTDDLPNFPAGVTIL